MKTYLRLSALGLFFLILINCPLVQAQQKNENIYQKLDNYLTQANKMGKFNGSALVARNGQIILHKGYGWKNFQARTLNDTNSIFDIGSLTKPFTAMLILKLQEEGKLSVRDLLSKYIPEQKGADEITIQNLLDHTSGLHDFSHDIPEDDSTLLSHPMPRETVLETFINEPLEFKPGTQYRYCNSDYFLLGMIIEKLTGVTWGQYLRKTIFEPLDMRHSGIDLINLKDTAKATGYRFLDASRQQPAVKWDSTLTYSAGAIYTTTSDLYKWARAISKRQILNRSSWDAAFTPHLEHYGDGFWIDTLYGNRYVYHSGGLPGFMSSFRYYPEQEVTIILLNNFGDYGQSLLQVNNALSAIVFKKSNSLLSAHIPINISDDILKTYVGTYSAKGSNNKVFITLKDHQLYAESSSKDGIPKLPIYAESENSFFLKDFDAQLIFVKDEHNQVTKFISQGNGKSEELKKEK